MAELLTQVNGKVRPLTNDEIAQRELDKQVAEQRKTAVAAKEAARQSGIEKLAALGLTVEEVSAVFGVG